MKRNRNGISLFLKRKIVFFETENHWPYNINNTGYSCTSRCSYNNNISNTGYSCTSRCSYNNNISNTGYLCTSRCSYNNTIVFQESGNVYLPPKQNKSDDTKSKLTPLNRGRREILTDTNFHLYRWSHPI